MTMSHFYLGSSLLPFVASFFAPTHDLSNLDQVNAKALWILFESNTCCNYHEDPIRVHSMGKTEAKELNVKWQEKMKWMC